MPSIVGTAAELETVGGGDGYQWESLSAGDSVRFGFSKKGGTGISFINQLAEKSAERNRILENGSGVAAGDVDGDGWVDLYFCRLEGNNVLYRNLGDFKFEDITESSGVGCPGQASAGAVLVDIDGDADLDLLVTGVGVGTRCFLNDSKGVFTEVVDSGLDREEGSMSMALADADGDGDLDLYVSNYQTVTWKDFPPGVKPRVTRVGGKPIAAPADRFVASLRRNGSTAITEIGRPDGFYLNEGGGRFRLVDWTAGTFLDEKGQPLKEPPRHWGLSVAFRDFNGDRLPDLYVCNDFLYGNDDFFLNQGEGLFRRIDRSAIRHSSWSAMAVDVADINRDGHFDFMVVDMLSQDLTRRLTQRANHETGAKLREVGVILDRPQAQHNSLYLNRGDGSFAEIAHLAGLEASEWSWSMAFLDVDLDGFEDALIGNGHAHDLLDGDITIEATHAMRSAPRGQAPRTLLMYPRLDLPDLAFRNRGDLTFEDVSAAWGFNEVGVSSAICRADLDEDGDWDVVVNRLQAEALVFENVGSGSRIQVRLEGLAANSSGAGALVRLVPEPGTTMPVQQQELVVGGRYLSSDESALVFAGGSIENEFRLEVTWRGGQQSTVDGVRPNRRYVVKESSGSAVVGGSPSQPAGESAWFADRSRLLGHQHQDVLYDDRERQLLLPRLLSQQGPSVSWGDVNQDGFFDLILPPDSSSGPRFYLNQQGKGFRQAKSVDSPFESAAGLWMQVDADSYRYVIGRSNYREASRAVPGLEQYRFQDGAPSVRESLPGQEATVGPVVSFDYDRDGDLDLFVGGRVQPGRYPAPAISRLYQNHGGRFRLDLEESRKWVDLGMVSGAVAVDIDGDSDLDLVMALEWSSIRVWLNEDGSFADATERYGFQQYRGWWNSIAAGDFDGDGRWDLVAGNWGRNTKYERYRSAGLRMAYGDVDGDGSVETFELVHDTRRQRWGTIRDLIVMGLAVPSLQQRTHSYTGFANLSMDEAFGSSFSRLPILEVDWLESTVFLNRGESFSARPLPIEVQFAPVFGLVVGDFNGDGNDDLFAAQNFFATQPETSRYDAGLGQLLWGDGKGSFVPVSASESGLRILGEQRGAAAADYDRDGRLDLVVTQNGAETRLFRNERARENHLLRLQGVGANQQAIGASVRQLEPAEEGRRRGVFAGGGYWSQDSSVIVWPVADHKQVLEVQWPEGATSRIEIQGRAQEWVVPHPNVR